MASQGNGKGSLLFLSAILYSTLSMSLASAQSPTTKTVVNQGEAAEKKTCIEADTGTLVCRQGPNGLKGLHWGVGVLYNASLGGVGEVKLVDRGANKVVQVTKENGAAARAAFELHYFVPAPVKLFGIVDFAIGPFVSLNTKPLNNLSGGQTFSSVGAGLMIGADAYLGDNMKNTVNLGIGWLVDTDVKQLAPGISDGQKTTITEESQLTRATTKSGFMAILSYNFTLN